MKIHQIWIDETIPSVRLPWIQTWLNLPGHEYKMWRASDVAVYTDEIKATEIETLHPAFISDFVRLLILRDEGGLYVDTDCELRGEIPNLETFSCALDYSGMSCNYMMFSPSGGQFIKNLIDYGKGIPPYRSVCERFASEAINAWCGTQFAIEYSSWMKHHSQRSWMNSPTTKYRNRK